MDIRLASARDANRIAEIHTSSWRNTYQNALSPQYLADIVPHERQQLWAGRLAQPKINQHAIVAEQDDVIIGFACAFTGENPEWGTYLENLHVLQDFQLKGIGKALLAEVARRCQQQSRDSSLCLLVNQDNVNAQGFYQALGARNARAAVWNAPDGSAVPTYWFVWDNISALTELCQEKRRCE